MEIKTTHMRTKAVYFKACYTSSKGVDCNHLCFGRLKVRQINGRAFWWIKRKALGVLSLEAVGMGELEVG